MFGFTRRKPAKSAEPVQTSYASADDVAGTLHESFRVLEFATLTLDGIAHGLSEAKMLARSAARPDGAAQRGLIAARYAFLKEQIERRSAEQTLNNGISIAVALGADEENCWASAMTRELPSCTFTSAEEARAIADVMEQALRAVETEATLLRDAAGHVADEIAKVASLSPSASERPPVVEEAAPQIQARPVMQQQKKRRAA